MSTRRRLSEVIFIVSVLLLVSLADAKVKYVPIEKMPAIADFVIIGTVIDSTSRWGDRGIMIFTDYIINVKESIIGDVPPTIKMSFAGGTVGGKTIIVTDTPVLNIGETYVLFGYNNTKYSVPVVGHEQGVFRVVYDRVMGKEFIVDYNWYQLEITKEGEIMRGPLTEVDSQGALAVRKIEEKQKAIAAPRPVFRDHFGQEIPQDDSVFTKPKVRKPGTPVTRFEFTGFIRLQIGDKGDKGDKK